MSELIRSAHPRTARVTIADSRAKVPDSPTAFAELSNFTIHPPSVQLLQQAWCLLNHVVVLGVVDPRSVVPVTLGVLDPSDERMIKEASQRLQRRVSPVRLNDWEIRQALGEGNGEVADPGRIVLRPPARLTFDPNAGVALYLAEILASAVKAGASDVHIETYESDVDVRFRVDGILLQVATPLSKDNIAAVISRIKVIAGLDIAERQIAQDGRISATLEIGTETRAIDFRVSVVPSPFGEDAVLRILDSSAPLIGLEKLGLDQADLTRFSQLISNPEGLVLVTGPTGSGKTTTLYAAIDRLNHARNKILTVEDPVEYYFAKCNQKQVTPKMGFAAYARSFMRQNPDIILIGEIRDEETADVTMRAAQTGHLVLATVHANDAVRAVSRLGTLGVNPSTLAGVLLGAVSQRLLRRLCADCREERAPSPDEIVRLGLAPGDTAYFAGRGCASCGGDGYRGRVGVYELFVLDDELADWVAEDRPVHELRRRAIAKGMRTLLQDGLEKARAGLTSLAELQRAVPYRMMIADQG